MSREIDKSEKSMLNHEISQLRPRTAARFLLAKKLSFRVEIAFALAVYRLITREWDQFRDSVSDDKHSEKASESQPYDTIPFPKIDPKDQQAATTLKEQIMDFVFSAPEHRKDTEGVAMLRYWYRKRTKFWFEALRGDDSFEKAEKAAEKADREALDKLGKDDGEFVQSADVNSEKKPAVNSKPTKSQIKKLKKKLIA